jgi:predicted negative regulator of RcsB-dependent stress response
MRNIRRRDGMVIVNKQLQAPEDKNNGRGLPEVDYKEDEFLSLDSLIPSVREAAERNLKRILGEIDELTRERKWEDIISIFYPIESKQAELLKLNMDVKVRSKVAFALGQVKRFDEAIKELQVCVRNDPLDFYYHNSLGFTAYNSLFSSMNKEIFLRGQARAERIDLAHKHLQKAQELRQDGVTNFYREGMLYRKIESKNEKALPLFKKAVLNWDKLSEQERQARQQEKKNYIKALYQLASLLLEENRTEKSLEVIKRCLSADEKTNYLSLTYKYFALGKVHYYCNNFPEARDALMFAMQCESNENIDFVYELLGRTYLAMGSPDRAMECINKLPENRRRPYYRWTEADILCALQDFENAVITLKKSMQRDNRSRHKALVRLAKISYVTGDFSATMRYANDAGTFFYEKWGNVFNEALFWKALGAYKSGKIKESMEYALELKSYNPHYPKLKMLLDRLNIHETV